MKKTFKSILALTMLLIILLGTAVNADDSNLQLNKTTGSLTLLSLEGQTDLEGKTFDIYKVGDDETSKSIPTDTTILASKQSATVGTTGTVTFSNLELGRYLVVEASGATGATGKIANFLVDIPMTVPGETADTLDYEVEVTPKENTTYGTITLTNYGMLLWDSSTTTVLEGSTFKLQIKDGSTWKDATAEILTTDENGQIFVEGLEVGTYQFVQQKVNDGYFLDEEAYQFDVAVDSDGNTVISTDEITVTNGKPQITKEIIGGLTNGSANIGDTISFRITSTFLSNDLNGYSYSIEDVLPEGLTLVEDSLYSEMTSTARFVGGDSETTTCTWNETTRTITTTGYVPPAAFGGDTIVVTYDAILNENANMTGTVNTATLNYSNIKGIGSATHSLQAEATVYTGGFNIEKRALSATGDLLSGAEFKLASSLESAKNGVYMSDSTGAEITLITDENGEASYKGLAYGTYYLVETKAPTYVDGATTKSYNLLRNPVEIIVDSDTYSGDATIIINKKGIELPGTGSIGGLIITAIGVVIVYMGVKYTKNDSKKIAKH